MVSASGEYYARIYAFSLGIHRIDDGIMGMIDDINGAEFNGNDKFEILLGMDVIGHCSFKTDNDGHFSLCW